MRQCPENSTRKSDAGSMGTHATATLILYSAHNQKYGHGAPWYVRNENILRDLGIPPAKNEVSKQKAAYCTQIILQGV